MSFTTVLITFVIMETILVVEGLTSTITREDVESHFSEEGQVQSVTFPAENPGVA